jgi:hypothetical protein
MAVIGFAGAIFYGSQFVKEEVNAGATLPSTISVSYQECITCGLENSVCCHCSNRVWNIDLWISQ